MLETLDKYIQEQPNRGGPFSALFGGEGRDRRFSKIVVMSVVGHLIVLTVILQLDFYSLHPDAPDGGRETSIIKFVDLAPPPDRLPMRPPPEPPERADLKNMTFDPENSDDTHLISRSRNPGAASEKPSLPQPPRPSVAETRPRTVSSSEPATPPKANATPPEVSVVAQTPPPQNQPAQAVPQNSPAINPPPDSPPSYTQGSARRGEGDGAQSLGLEASKSQYIAYVRSKITRANEKIIPRDWIKTVLTDRVSADFVVTLGRNGDILSARLVRRSGYTTLDSKAREAIYNARPFEGYPQNADDTMTITVTVYYAPTW